MIMKDQVVSVQITFRKRHRTVIVQVFLTRLGPVLLDCDGRSLSLRYAEG